MCSVQKMPLGVCYTSVLFTGLCCTVHSLSQSVPPLPLYRSAVVLLLAGRRGQVGTLAILPMFVTQCPYPHCRPLFYPSCFYSTSRPVVLNWVQFYPCPQGLFGNVYKHFQLSQPAGTSSGWRPGMLLNVLQYTGQPSQKE